MLRCAQLGLSAEDLSQMSIGMVYDLLTERNNDDAEYSIIGNQDDIEGFFPAG